MSGNEYKVIDNTDAAIDAYVDEVGSLEYDTQELHLKLEDLEVLRSGKAIAVCVGSIGTCEYTLIIKVAE